MDIHLVQMAIARNKPELNRAKVQALTAPLAGKAGRPGLILLPELFSTGFLDEASAARPGPGGADGESWGDVARRDEEFLSALARNLGFWVSGTTVEVGDDTGAGPRFCNAIRIFGPDGADVARYRKVHPFSYGGEDRLFAGGREVVTFEIEGMTVQPTVCYDLRFPELYRAGSQRGAHLILVQANWPDARQAHWETLLKARAIENQAYVAGVNCVGAQESLRYAGGSALIDPKGEYVAQAHGAEGVARGQADLERVRQWRKAFPALRDRRPQDFYRG